MVDHMSRQRREKTGKLQPKLTRIVLATVFAACLLIYVIVIYTSYHYYRTQEINNQRYQLDKTASQISMLQNTVANLAKQVTYDDVIQSSIAEKASSTGTYLYQRRNAQATLTNYSHIMDAIHEVLIYTNEGITFTSREIRDAFDPEKNEWYQNWEATGRKSGYTEAHRSEPNQSGYTEDIISYVCSYYSVEQARHEMGKLIISVDYEELQRLAYLESDLLKGYALFDSQKQPLVQSGEMNLTYDEIMDAQQDGLLTAEGGNVFLISDNMQDGWVLVSEISGIGLVGRSLASYVHLIVIFVLILIGLMLVLRNLIRNIVNPINQLSNAVEEVGRGNFDLSVQIHTNDELEMLADVFNKMVVDIRELMHESVEHEKAIRRMQIENLMLQINPHFIYNTINSIVYMARMSGNHQIADFANAFVSLLQSTLNVRNSVYNTVREELKTVENYLILQKYRYADKFVYHIQCEEELMDCQILNVMLQPAVENAIFHGISPKDGKCVLTISIHREKDDLILCVEDDGVGMSQERLAELFTDEHAHKGDVRKIGVANVRDRIREIYGEPYNLKIESESGVGTRVIMHVPCLLSEELADENIEKQEEKDYEKQ